MPCRDYEDDIKIRTVEVDRPSTVEMLCEAARKLDAANVKMSTKLQLWWAAHKKEDEARLQAEADRLDKKQKRKVILSKLSAEEKRILGLE